MITERLCNTLKTVVDLNQLPRILIEDLALAKLFSTVQGDDKNMCLLKGAMTQALDVLRSSIKIPA